MQILFSLLSTKNNYITEEEVVIFK